MKLGKDRVPTRSGGAARHTHHLLRTRAHEKDKKTGGAKHAGTVEANTCVGKVLPNNAETLSIDAQAAVLPFRLADLGSLVARVRFAFLALSLSVPSPPLL